MIQDRLDKIEERLKQSQTVKESEKVELLNLLKILRTEITDLSKTRHEQAETSAGCDHGRPGWQTPRAILHGVEPGNGTSIWNDGQLASAIRRHAGREPAVLNPSQRLPNRVPGLFCAVSLPAIHRSAIRRGDAVLHRREQPLQRSSIDRDEAPRHMACKGRSTTPGAVAWIQSRTEDSFRFPQEGFSRLCRETWPATMVPATTTSGTISTRSMCISCRSECAVILWATRSTAGRFRERRFGTAEFRSRC